MNNPVTNLYFLLAVFLVIIAIFSKRDLLSSMLRGGRKNERILMEDALKSVQQSEFRCNPASLQGIAGVLKISPDRASKLIKKMSDLNLIKMDGNEIHLTSVGFGHALHLTRAHRLSEEYLAQQTEWPLEEIHRRADKVEHGITGKELEDLSLRLGNPLYDPHGDPIPSPKGKVKHFDDQPLTASSENQTFVITHLEDEPEEIFSQLSAEGLRPGMIVHIADKTQQKIRFWSEAGEHVLAPLFAANITVAPICEVSPPQQDQGLTLSDLPIGKDAEIKELSPFIRKYQRRRLMDLGIIPGTVVKAEMRSPNGDPTAFRIRGTVIALRQEQTDSIKIQAPYSEKETLADDW